MALERETYTYTPYEREEYAKSDEVKSAEAKQNELATKVETWKPTQFSQQEQYDKLMADYQNRGDFTYDFNADALYQQYKDKYIQQGKMAMADTMGQAAAMTGGYGNSYSQTVGNQAYQASLQNLNDVIPELYQMAYDRYNQKGQDMLNKIGLLSGERDYEHTMDNEAYGRLADQLNYAMGNAQYLAESDYVKWSDRENALQNEHWKEQDYKYQDVADANAFAQWEKEFGLSEKQVELMEKELEEGLKQWEKEFALEEDKYELAVRELDEKLKQWEKEFGLSEKQVELMEKELDAKLKQWAEELDLEERKVVIAEKEYDAKYNGDSSKGDSGETETGGSYPQQDEPEDVGFTGSSYSDAVAFMESKGVPSANACGVMTASEWNGRKSSYQSFGQGSASVKNYSSYSEYLKAFVEYAVETYGR